MPPVKAAPQVTYYIVLTKQPPDVGGSIRPISRLLQEEEDSVRQQLLAPSFQVLRRFAKKSNAEGLRNQLKSLGVDSLLVSDQSIRGHLILYAATASKGAGGIAFRDFADKPLFCPFGDIAALVFMQIPSGDDGTSTFIDIHRTSTNITVRIDTSLFDFGQMMGREGAGYEDLIKDLEERAKISVDREFNKHAAHHMNMMRDFGSFPSQFEPPPAMLLAPYDKDGVRAANSYTYLYQVRLKQLEAE